MSRAEERIAELRRAGVGGDLLETETADALVRGARMPWRDVLAITRRIAEALAACETRGLFPGPLTPASIVTAPTVWLRADALLAALAGDDAGVVVAPSLRFTPPEQAAGAPWDSAANRYVLGLVTYRLVAGEHAFHAGAAGGAGLRHALAAQSAGAPPPFEASVASELRPGVQSFVLAMIDARAQMRPVDAKAIARSCADLLGEGADVVEAPARVRATARATRAGVAGDAAVPRENETRSTRTSSRFPRALVAMAPLVVGLGIAFALAPSALGPAPPAAASTPIAPRAVLGDTRASACASCHPTQVAEWQRSVMAFAGKSPLYGALESAVEEQVGRDDICPQGAGVLRVPGARPCRVPETGARVTGAGGEHWCVSCHAPGENIAPAMPGWNAVGDARSRAPMRDLLPEASMEGISCIACHATIGPVDGHGRNAPGTRGGGAGLGGAYEGNATWTSFLTGAEFAARPEDREGLFGIGNSGYALDRARFLAAPRLGDDASVHDPVVHARPSPATKAYLKSSEACGACHDVRLFGTDVVGRARGEHFKRLRNAYSEWRTWSEIEARAGRTAPTCAGCHMSLYPGTCAPTAAGPSVGTHGREGCPPGTGFTAKAPGARPGLHYFTSVDLPLADSYPDAFADDATLDGDGLPVGLRARRDLLLAHTFRFELGAATRGGRDAATLEIPVVLENTGAGHRVPAGFSQEREIWVELTVTDARGRVVYEVGHVPSNDADLADKTFLRITTRDTFTDRKGRPLGVFGADIADGPDVPQWSPSPTRGGTQFRGRGLVNLQNGFLRCVRCIGVIDGEGRCQADRALGQGRTRSDRYADGDYDLDSGTCTSNLSGGEELFETYFPVGALDADRGVVRAPDAIVDTRSAPPGVPLTYTYVLPIAPGAGPFHVAARLRFRAFPPYLLRAFADYEAQKAAEGLRPSGPQVRAEMLRRIDIVELAHVEAEIP